MKNNILDYTSDTNSIYYLAFTVCTTWLDCLHYTLSPSTGSLHSEHGRHVDAGHVALLRDHLECFRWGYFRHERVLAAFVVQDLRRERHHGQCQPDKGGDEHPSCMCADATEMSVLPSLFKHTHKHLYVRQTLDVCHMNSIRVRAG